jgi:hypothetical protein
MSVTLEDLQVQVRERADMVNSKFVEDDELTGYINKSYSKLRDLLISKHEDYYVEDPYAFTVASGATTADLPANFYKLRGLDKSIGGQWVEVTPFAFLHRNKNTFLQTLSGDDVDVQYRIVGDRFIFSPPENAPGDYQAWLIPVFTPLEETDDVLEGIINGWEEYIVVDSAIKCLAKEESDISALVLEKQELTARIEALANGRDAGYPDAVVDVYRRESIRNRYR